MQRCKEKKSKEIKKEYEKMSATPTVQNAIQCMRKEI